MTFIAVVLSVLASTMQTEGSSWALVWPGETKFLYAEEAGLSTGTGWFMTVYRDPIPSEPDPSRYILMHWSAECSSTTITVDEAVLYGSDHAVIDRIHPEPGTQQVSPGSTAQLIFDALCHPAPNLPSNDRWPRDVAVNRALNIFYLNSALGEH